MDDGVHGHVLGAKVTNTTRTQWCLPKASKMPVLHHYAIYGPCSPFARCLLPLIWKRTTMVCMQRRKRSKDIMVSAQSVQKCLPRCYIHTVVVLSCPSCPAYVMIMYEGSQNSGTCLAVGHNGVCPKRPSACTIMQAMACVVLPSVTYCLSYGSAPRWFVCKRVTGGRTEWRLAKESKKSCHVVRYSVVLACPCLWSMV